MLQNHTFLPIHNLESQILILGSFPSVISRQREFYYSHPQNRFWKILEQLFKTPLKIPLTKASNSQKRDFLLLHKIALYDVVATCEIEGSSDTKLKIITPNPIDEILNQSPAIRAIFLNGQKAAKLYQKHFAFLKIPAFTLPSSSPANAKYDLEKLLQEWRILKNYCQD
ncbi:MAG: DNA-deoxyinosine glycosylase [Helicobacter sp.]|nr:DNA-deoxyinosine glycosylase [Helicobacter sp.]